MDKSILKNFAIYARNKLIQDIKNKASMIGVTEEGIENPLPESTSDMLVFDIKAIETHKIYDKEVKQYEALINELNERKHNTDYKTAYNTLVEEVAYTWFNRLIAVRFMEVNNYLPHKMRVLSSGREGVNEPEFVTYYQDTDFNFADKELEQLINWKLDGSAASMEKMFHLLFIKQCNALNENLPELFEKTDDYAELLLTISYIDEEGVLYKLVNDIPEQYFDIESKNGDGQVEIIGWMYQYYNTERKDEVFSRPRSVKIQKEDIPAITQLFTPDWIVKYMVENSLGRLWIEKLIAGGDMRTEKEIVQGFGWKYYTPEAEQSPEVTEQLIGIRRDRKDIQPEDIKFIDPAMGSFHIGVYAFEIFMQLYESQGYTAREAANLIIEKNLYGLDIDKRAYQLSYFACMMKGRQYNRRILNGKTKCNLYDIPESNNINRTHLDYLGSNVVDKKIWNELKEELVEILDIFKDAKEYGSILKVANKYDFGHLRDFASNIKSKIQLSVKTIGIEKTQKDILKILNVAKILSQKYDVVVTNPPYMGSSGMNPKLSKYVKDNYSDSRSDLFAIFIERCRNFTKNNGYYSMITQHAWMFLSSFEKLREKQQTNTICNMVHLGARAFSEIGGEVVQTTAFVFRGSHVNDYRGSYIRLVDFNNAEEKEIKTLEAIQNPKCGYYYETEQDNFEKIPGIPIAYWVSDRVISIFEDGKPLAEIAQPRKGNSTSDNNRFLKLWYEVNYLTINYNCTEIIKEITLKKRWFPYNKGGGYRRWYGNNEYLIDWQNDAEEIRKIPTAVIANYDFFMKPGLTWSTVTSKNFSIRLFDNGFIFDNGGCCLFTDIDERFFYLALLNSKVFNYILGEINPTLNFQSGEIAKLPILKGDRKWPTILVDNISEHNTGISKTDWNSFETSWDFKIHPLLSGQRLGVSGELADSGELVDSGQGLVTSDQKLIDGKKLPTNYYPLPTNHYPLNTKIEQAYEQYKNFANTQFRQLKSNEEELNRIFIEIYGLEDELTPEVSDKDITITKIFDTKEEIYEDIKGNRYILTKEDVIKSFISYAVGCMFGRYSLDIEGLVYAGGEFSDKWLEVSGQYYLKEVVYRYVGDALSRFDSMAEADSQGVKSGAGDIDFDMYQTKVLDAITNGDTSGLVSRGWENAERIDWKTIHCSLITNHYNIVKDNVILITDEEYFEDDIVNRFVDFVRVVYGEKPLEKNLNFIAGALGGRGTPKEIIRNYFLKDFYKDHIKTYKKRPIYWQYDSGKQNGFKAIIYMHRYNEDTTGRVRIDYLHKMQKAYEGVIDNLRYTIANNKNSREVAKAEKHLTKAIKQLKECKDYDERIAHLAVARISIDLDDGVKINYDKIQTDEKGKNLQILAKI